MRICRAFGRKTKPAVQIKRAPQFEASEHNEDSTSPQGSRTQTGCSNSWRHHVVNKLFPFTEKIYCTTKDKKHAIKWPMRRSSSLAMATRFKDRVNGKLKITHRRTAKGIVEEIGH